ncbi:MAG: endonuclease/exonuclease/phosphatase family protein [Paracoccaceae bacterium]
MAEPLRIATFHVDLPRAGPGLLLRDILRGDPQVEAVARIVAENAPDALLLTDFDYDHGLAALRAFRDVVGQAGHAMPHLFALRPNTGMATGLDMDGDGRTGTPRDNQGFGRFAGEGGMAILSRLPVEAAGVRDFSDLLWRDLPGALLPETAEGAPFLAPRVLEVQRLSTTGHWVVPLRMPDGSTMHLLAFDATPPVFDGPEDLNGRRNHDELRFWQLFLDGAFGPPPSGRFVILGNANLDPEDGEGRRAAIRALLADPRLQDPRPASAGGAAVADPAHRGNPALDTVDWDGPEPGNLRVDYVLPSADWRVTGAGVVWPGDGTAEAASRHRLVWVDLLPPD